MRMQLHYNIVEWPRTVQSTLNFVLRKKCDKFILFETWAVDSFLVMNCTWDPVPKKVFRQLPFLN